MTTLFCSVIAIGYALTAQEWWSAKATVSQPQLQGIASYQQAVKRYQPLFDVYQEDGSIIVSETLDLLIDPEVIFKRFIQEFNANGTKRRFMQTNSTFLTLQNRRSRKPMIRKLCSSYTRNGLIAFKLLR